MQGLWTIIAKLYSTQKLKQRKTWWLSFSCFEIEFSPKEKKKNGKKEKKKKKEKRTTAAYPESNYYWIKKRVIRLDYKACSDTEFVRCCGDN